MLPFSVLNMKVVGSSESLELSIILHGVTTQKAIVFIFTLARIRDLPRL